MFWVYVSQPKVKTCPLLMTAPKLQHQMTQTDRYINPVHVFHKSSIFLCPNVIDLTQSSAYQSPGPRVHLPVTLGYHQAGSLLHYHCVPEQQLPVRQTVPSFSVSLLLSLAADSSWLGTRLNILIGMLPWLDLKRKHLMKEEHVYRTYTREPSNRTGTSVRHSILAAEA